ncbi:autotransporter-associated beta strand protein [Bradyrhizobium sp. CIR48]|uniref:autotransporter family protein n=1 Tax=Bradyrhizobium sp. CIR48 TaxID=2663840 RepID=UPI001606D1DE|nr:autotransporter outer membrane beta-barrel domain-containing protein [Bradyrhizobium sp. CIR48]MBB4426562.1 autotransporter-associated beta strand protein [Bradyrhizobium sp. CIR48]
MLRPKTFVRFLLATSSLVTAALSSSPAARAQTIDYASGEVRGIPIDLDGGDVTLNVAPGNPAFQSGDVIGANGINKTGSGTLVLSGVSDYVGDTRLAGGFLLFGAQGALGRGKLILSGGDVGFKAGGSLTISGMSQDDRIISRFMVSNGETLRLKIANGGSFGAGKGSILYLGVNGFGGTIEIDSAAFVGEKSTTNVRAGTVRLARSSEFGLSSSRGGLEVDPGATYDLNGNSAGASALSLFGGGVITNTAGDTTSYVTVGSEGNFAGRIVDDAGQVGLIKQGLGTLILGGVNTYTGTTTVSAGTLSVNGSIASSLLTTVNAGGTLGGTGTVGNTVINGGGALAPGNSIGTLKVAGSLTFAAASSYMVEVSPASADRTNVTGTATLGSATVNASFASGTYVAKRYTILNAAGGVSGTFGALANTNLPSGFRSSLSYDTSNVYLDLALNFSSPSSGLNVNQRNVANALTTFFNTSGGIPMMFGALDPAGLTRVSGEVATGAQQSTFNAMNQFMGVLSDPFIEGRRPAIASHAGANSFAEEPAPNPTRPRSNADAYAAAVKAGAGNPYLSAQPVNRWSVWAAGYGGSQTTNGSVSTGSNTATNRIYGTAVGADYRLSPETLVGFALAGGGTSFSIANGLGRGSSDLFQAGAFVRHNAGNAYLSGALAYGWQDVSTDRAIGTDQLRAKFNANALSGRLEGGWHFVAPWMGLTPYAAAQVTRFDLPTYAERASTGAGTFALGYAAKDVTATRTELGLRADKSFAMQDAILTLRGRAAWAHDFNTERGVAATFQTLPGASFVVNGAAPAHDSTLTTASAELKWLNGFSLGGTFEGEFSTVTHSYAGKGVVRYAW